jgi:hypothetical protein
LLRRFIGNLAAVALWPGPTRGHDRCRTLHRGGPEDLPASADEPLIDSRDVMVSSEKDSPPYTNPDGVCVLGFGTGMVLMERREVGRYAEQISR